MSDKFFIDTNIFVYSFDSKQPEKRDCSLALIHEALETGQGLISSQVVIEFLNVATRKFSVPLKSQDCRVYLSKVLHPLCQVFPDLTLFQIALDISQETGYSFYDALILAGAVRGECAILYSEDLHAGQQVHGVKIVNPFVETTRSAAVLPR